MAENRTTDFPAISMADAWSDIQPPTDDGAEVDAPPAATFNAAPENRVSPADKEDPSRSDDLDDSPSAAEPEETGGWTVAVLCAGIAIIAACLLLPLAEVNHQLAWQKQKLQIDLEQIQQQVELNGEFLHRVNDDPTLAERLAQRQMKFIREGTTILDLHDSRARGGDDEPQQASPFQLVTLPPPSPMPAYRSMGGALMTIVLNSRVRLYLIGIGLLLLACGLVLGGGNKQTYESR